MVSQYSEVGLNDLNHARPMHLVLGPKDSVVGKGGNASTPAVGI